MMRFAKSLMDKPKPQVAVRDSNIGIQLSVHGLTRSAGQVESGNDRLS